MENLSDRTLFRLIIIGMLLTFNIYLLANLIAANAGWFQYTIFIPQSFGIFILWLISYKLSDKEDK